MKIPQSILQVDANQAAYWNGYVTRKELQATFDHLKDVIQDLVVNIHGDTGVEEGKQVRPSSDGLVMIIAKLDMTLAYVMEKLGVTPAEFQEYMNRKMAEFAAIQAKAKADDEIKKAAKAAGPQLVV